MKLHSCTSRPEPYFLEFWKDFFFSNLLFLSVEQTALTLVRSKGFKYFLWQIVRRTLLNTLVSRTRFWSFVKLLYRGWCEWGRKYTKSKILSLPFPGILFEGEKFRNFRNSPIICKVIRQNSLTWCTYLRVYKRLSTEISDVWPG